VRQRPAKGTVARLVIEYRSSPEFAGLAPSTRNLYRAFLDRIGKRFGRMSLDEFNGKEGRAGIRAWRNEDGVTPRTADQVLTVIGAMATWARQADKAERDFYPTVDMPQRYVAPPQEAWSKEDVDRAMTGLPPHLSRVVALCLNTGLRRADLCALTWSAIDWDAGVIRWHTSKGRKKRRVAVIDLTEPLLMALKRCPRGDAVTVLTNSYGLPWKPTGLATSMDKALTRLGIEGRLHGLRRTAATHLAAQGMSSREIARRLGWSETEAEAMTATYVDEEARRLASLART
jgi:integrase